MSEDNLDIQKIIVEDPSRKRFEYDIPVDAKLESIVADFCEELNWLTTDSRGMKQRVVLELVDPENPDRTKRLNAEDTFEKAGLWNGAIIRIFPESIAGCFLGNVNISLSDGRKKEIRDIIAGDIILSYIPNSNELSTSKVEKIFKNITHDYLVLNNNLSVTRTQRIWANDKWVKVGDLNKGDLLFDRFGKKVELKSIEHRSVKVDIYNLIVSHNAHTFFAEDLLVHSMICKSLIPLGDSSENICRKKVYNNHLLNSIDKSFDENYTKTTNSLENFLLTKSCVKSFDEGYTKTTNPQKEYQSTINLIEKLQTQNELQESRIQLLEKKIDSLESKLAVSAKLLHDLSNVFQPKDNQIKDNKKALARIQINKEIDNYRSVNQKELIDTISNALNISKDEINPLYLLPGSVIVALEMPDEAAKKLMALYLEMNPIIHELQIENIKVQHLPVNSDKMYLPIQTKKICTKILFLSANPSDTERIRIDEEVKQIRNNVKLSPKYQHLEFEQEFAVTTDSLMQAILDKSPNIIHFSGHGQHEGIIIQNENGESKLITVEALTNLFKLFKDSVNCVIINSCFSKIQAEAIKEHIPNVIGMGSAIPDRAAIAFSIGFYKAIGNGRDIQFAFDLGIAAIKLEGVTGDDIPTLL